MRAGLEALGLGAEPLGCRLRPCLRPGTLIRFFTLGLPAARRVFERSEGEPKATIGSNRPASLTTSREFHVTEGWPKGPWNSTGCPKDAIRPVGRHYGSRILSFSF